LAFANRLAARDHPEKPMPSHERAASLRRIEIFRGLSDDALTHLAQSCKWRQFAAGERILDYHDETTDVLFLLAGKARAIIYSAEGKAVVFADLVPGTMFGEIAAIDRKPRSASVEALDICTVASLSAAAFEALLVREPSAAVATLKHVTAEVRRLSERVFEFSTLMVRNRLHAELIRLATETGDSGDEVVLSPAPSLSDIAGRISTHREAVSRELSRLVTGGLLRRERGNLIVVSVTKLAKLVHEAKQE
jgi:CRP-like cAMP-binding protein